MTSELEICIVSEVKLEIEPATRGFPRACSILNSNASKPHVYNQILWINTWTARTNTKTSKFPIVITGSSIALISKYTTGLPYITRLSYHV